MSILDQFNNPDSQQDDHSQFVDTLEAFGALAFIWWVIHRIRIHHQYASALILLISSVAAFLVMINLDMTSDAAYLFWSLVAVAFLSLAKGISLYPPVGGLTVA